MSNTIDHGAGSLPPRQPTASGQKKSTQVVTDGKSIGSVVIRNWDYLKSLKDITGCTIGRDIETGGHCIQLYSPLPVDKLQNVPDDLEGYRIEIFGRCDGASFDLDAINIQAAIAKHSDYLDNLQDLQGCGYGKDEAGYYIVLFSVMSLEDMSPDQLQNLSKAIEGYRVKLEFLGGLLPQGQEANLEM